MANLKHSGLHPALRAKVEEIRGHLAHARPRESLDRYRIGAVIHEIEMAPWKYGEGAVALVAEELDLGVDALYDAAKVASAWTEEADFRALATRPSRRGFPLSFSHFVALAEIADDHARAALAEEALALGLSVRDLRARVVERGRRPAYSFLHAIVNTSKSLDKRRATWRNSITMLEAAGPTQDLERLLEQALEAQRQLERSFAEDALLTESTLNRLRSTAK